MHLNKINISMKINVAMDYFFSGFTLGFTIVTLIHNTCMMVAPQKCILHWNMKNSVISIAGVIFTFTFYFTFLLYFYIFITIKNK